MQKTSLSQHNKARYPYVNWNSSSHGITVSPKYFFTYKPTTGFYETYLQFFIGWNENWLDCSMGLVVTSALCIIFQSHDFITSQCTRLITDTCITFTLDFTLSITHWGWVTHICVGNLTIIGSDNGLLPYRRQAIIWTNDGILLIGHVGTNFSEISIAILTFSFKKIHLKPLSVKWRPFCLSLNVLCTITTIRL